MELALTIAAVIGVLLFVIAYLRFVVSGFKHHPVTGIIALFPVINVLVVPSLWYKNGRFLILGFVGLLLAVGAWMIGAEKGIHKYTNVLLGKDQQTIVSTQAVNTQEISTKTSALAIPKSKLNSKPIAQVATNTPPASPTNKSTSFSSSPMSAPTRILDESNLQELPSKALYRMAFDTISINEIVSLNGRIVKVLDKNLTSFEGRIASVSPSSVSLKLTGNLTDVEIPISNIKKLSLMVKKPL